MPDIAKNINDLKSKLPDSVTLVAVSKTKPAEAVMEAYQAGHRDFGENKVQEMVAKWEVLPGDINWHMIGHVQRNKVKYMASFVGLIHAVDSLRLLREIEKQAAKNDRVIPCLLQIKIAEEDSKFGLSAADALAILESDEVKAMDHVRIRGLMGMATFTDDTGQVSREFEFLSELYKKWKDRFGFDELSMGMSGDYPLALEKGTSMVRVGTAIFGERDYS